MRKRRILIFIDWFTPGYKAGGPIQSCANMIAHLKDEFDFRVITRDTDYCETIPYPSVTSNAWNEIDKNVQVYYLSKDKLNYSNLSKAVGEAKPDVVFINGIYSFYFSILPLFIMKGRGDAKVIISSRGMLAPSAIKVKGGKKNLFLKLAKAVGIYKNVNFHATNEEEKRHIKNILGTSQPVFVAPNLPKPDHTRLNLKREKQIGQLRLVSIARISPEKNTKYALEALEELNIEGNIHFDIFGPVYNATYWTECLQVIKRLPENIVVAYKGSLESNKVHNTLQNYHALFMPTRGENFGHIILESLSAGCLVLISDQTPWKELKNKGIGFDLPLSEPQAFAAALQLLLNQTQVEFDRCSEEAYIYAQNFVQDQESINKNLLMFKNL